MTLLFIQVDARFILLVIILFDTARIEGSNSGHNPSLSSLQFGLLKLVDEQIQTEKARLTKLENLYRDIVHGYGKTTLASARSEAFHPEHPLDYFVYLNHIHKKVARLREAAISIEEPNESSFSSQIETFLEHKQIPDQNQLLEYAQSLFRLQKFYNLDAQSMIHEQKRAHKSSSHSLEHYRVEPHDCFTLGKIAYENGLYSISLGWFKVVLEVAGLPNIEDLDDDNLKSVDSIDQSTLIEVFDYLAYAAYQIGDLGYAIKLTKLWLHIDPGQERANANLLFYEEELVDGENLQDTQDKVNNSFNDIHPDYLQDLALDLESYEPGEDPVVRELCRKPQVPDTIRARCLSKLTFIDEHLSPELRIETLNIEPEILRIYDIISQKEAYILHQLASPKLKRSTVKVDGNLVSSKFRSAQTAWLSNKLHPVVERLENRLSRILDLDLRDSENLQVVNYGFGGFYGPHLDSSRMFRNRSSDPQAFDLENQESDRLATILIYLNQVPHGGSTAFPKLGLTVEPVERSAVVWFNLLEDGFSDERSLHTGCPVFSGTKWIATKWPRDKPNIRLRVCKWTSPSSTIKG